MFRSITKKWQLFNKIKQKLNHKQGILLILLLGDGPVEIYCFALKQTLRMQKISVNNQKEA